MTRPEAAEAALAAVPSIPRHEGEPVFPAPWAAAAFAMTLALHQRGLFTWPDWAGRLGAAIADDGAGDPADPEAYWRCWLAALEETISAGGLAAGDDLQRLQAAWRSAAAATPHGEPIVLSNHVKGSSV